MLEELILSNQWGLLAGLGGHTILRYMEAKLPKLRDKIPGWLYTISSVGVSVGITIVGAVMSGSNDVAPFIQAGAVSLAASHLQPLNMKTPAK